MDSYDYPPAEDYSLLHNTYQSYSTPTNDIHPLDTISLNWDPHPLIVDEDKPLQLG